MLIVAMLLVFSLLTAPAPVWADLEEFKEGVEEEEKNREKKEEDKDNEEEEAGEANPFLELIYQITLFIWLAHNGSAHYESYPYAERGNALVRHDMERSRSYWDTREAGTGGTEKGATPEPAKSHWFELSAGGIGFSADCYDPFPPEGYGGFASLQGRFFPFLGPDIDYRSYYDASGELHITGVGLDLPLVQTDPFSWSVYGKWVGWRGTLNRDGGASGFTFRSYLFRPLSLYLRAGGVFFPHVTIGQVEGRLNLHLGSVTLFGGVNVLETERSKYRLMSFEAGSSVYF